MFQNFKRILEQKKGHECIQNTTKVNADASYTVHETYFLQLRPNHNNIMLRTDASRIQKKKLSFAQTLLPVRNFIPANFPPDKDRNRGFLPRIHPSLSRPAFFLPSPNSLVAIVSQ